VDYDVPHRKAWGLDLVLYLMTKGISTGAMMLSAILWLMGDRSALVAIGGPIVSVVFSIATAVVLIIDLERPERFFYILTRPNWTSWMARGAFLLTGHGALTSLWILLYLLGWSGALTALAPIAFVVALGATAYTGLLFAQGLARDLWQGPHHTIDLIVQAAAEGSAAMLIVAMFIGSEAATIRALGVTLAMSSIVHLGILVMEYFLTTSATLHHQLAVRAVRRGAYRQLFWVGALGLGGLAPIVLIALAAIAGFTLPILVPAALVALTGSLAWEYIWVEAGQSVPIS